MFREETLSKEGKRLYEEPDGEFLELIETNSNTITVLTRVELDKVAVESSPIDPTEYTVSELEDALDDDGYDWNTPALRGLLEAERNGDNRATAISAINDKQ